MIILIQATLMSLSALIDTPIQEATTIMDHPMITDLMTISDTMHTATIKGHTTDFRIHAQVIIDFFIHFLFISLSLMSITLYSFQDYQ